MTGAFHAVATDEFDATPYAWFKFNDSTEISELSEAVTFANSGTSTVTFSPSTGSIVATEGEDNYGWQFGDASYSPAIAKSGSSMSPASYLTKMNFNGASFSTWKVVWGTNGKAYGGYALCVNGNATDGYQVKVCRHDNGALRVTLAEYTVPVEKASGLHTYITTCNGSIMRLYLDGALVDEGWDGGSIPTQNNVFGFGQPGNAGANTFVPTGLILDDFRIYDSVLSAQTIGAAFGLTVESEPAVHFAFEGNMNNIGTESASFGGESPSAYLNLRYGDAANQGFATVSGSAHPWSSGNLFGSGDVVTIAASIMSVPTAKSTLFAVGPGNTPAVLGLFSGGENEVFVGEIASSGTDTLRRLVTATVEGATTSLHHYTITYDKSSKALALYVDGTLVADDSAATPTVAPAAGWQLGSIHGNAYVGGAARTSGVVFEDFAVYQEILSAERISALAAKFPPWTLGEFYVAEGEELTISSALTGYTTIRKTGAGTLTLAAANTSITSVIVEGGLLKTTNGQGYGANATPLTTIEVKAGATVDLANTANYSHAITIAGDGYDGNGALINSGTAITIGSRQTTELTLSADASIGSGTFGMVANGYGASTINLGEYTLTKKGEDIFYLCNTTVTGTGTIAVESGTLRVNRTVSTMAEATLSVGSAATVLFEGGGTLSVKNLTIARGATFTPASSLTVTGTLTLPQKDDGTICYYPVALGESASVSPAISAASNVCVIMSSKTASATVALAAGIPAENVTASFNGMTYALATMEIAEDGQVTVTPPLVRRNPVTGDEIVFTWAFRGVEDANWSNTNNWFKDGVTEWIAYDRTNAPHRNKRDDSDADSEGYYDPVLIDGALIDSEANRAVTVGQIEGWNTRIGVYGGATVTVTEGMSKWQIGSEQWLCVDGEGSKLTIAGGTAPGSNNQLPVYVSVAEGLEFTDTSFTAGNVLYRFAGKGSVKYASGCTGGTHQLRNAEIELGDSSKTKGVFRQCVVTSPNFTPTIATSAPELRFADAAAHPAAEAVYTQTPLGGQEAVGTWSLVNVAGEGVYIYYVGYGETPLATTPTLVGSGEVAWSSGNWNVDSVPTSGDVIVKATGNMALSIDAAVVAGTIKFVADSEATIELTIAENASLAASTFDVRTPVKLVVNAASGALPFTSMTGDGAMTLDLGAEDAVATISSDNISYTGDLTLRRGIFKMGHNNAFGVNSTAHTVIVGAGATLDFNGRANFIFPIRFEGGTVANTGAATTTQQQQFANLTFAADATIDAAANLYSIAYQWGAVGYALNGHKLTKKGAGIYGICTGNYTGTGEFDIREGTLSVDAGTVAADADLTFAVAEGAELQFATNVYQSGVTRSLTVNGTVRLTGAGRVSGSALAGSWTLRPDGEHYLVFADALAAPVEDGATTKSIPLDLSGIEWASRSRVPLFKVANVAYLPGTVEFSGLEDMPAKWRVSKTADGLGYSLTRPYFRVILR
ncbi:MAG: LamG-like jellyroll fold domain-containing protein [Kiritimatiellia bacterium]